VVSAKTKAKYRRIVGPTRSSMQEQLAYYLAALNVDTQFGIRKAIFLLRSLSLPEILSVREAMDKLVAELGVAREQAGIGRPWTQTQIARCYWAKTTRFMRRPPSPMLPEEWKTYEPVKEKTVRSRVAGLEKGRKTMKTMRERRDAARLRAARRLVAQAGL
jgi:hypothetical protein